MKPNRTELKLNLRSECVVSKPKTTAVLTVDRIIDFPGQKVVRAVVRELPGPVVLWSGDDYDKAGDWTQAQANERLLAIVQGAK